MDISRYRAERLPNGLIRVWDYACQWSGLYNANHTYHSGACSNLKPHIIMLLIARDDKPLYVEEK